MQTASVPEALTRLTYLTGSAELAAGLPRVPARAPFDGEVLAYLNAVSRALLADPAAKAYSDVATFAFWVRRASLSRLKERFAPAPGSLALGRGAAFHIAPSNVPVNFAFSLAAGLLCGNANLVRVPSRDWPQAEILVGAFRRALEEFPGLRPYVLLARYGRDREVNDCLSAMADVRIIWGGDETIAELRRSPLPPRALEVCFANRFSLAVVNAEAYLAAEDKGRIAEAFFNDTYLFDQNACTSPRFVVWTGERIPEAKALFWAEEHRLVARRYSLQPIQTVDKLSRCCLAAVAHPGARVEPHEDDLILRVRVPELRADLADEVESGGFFYEYDCRDIRELIPLCGDKRCQTLAYLGEPEPLLPLLEAGGRGVDRIVPLGRTMDFDLLWDGYSLPAMLTRTIPVIVA